MVECVRLRRLHGWLSQALRRVVVRSTCAGGNVVVSRVMLRAAGPRDAPWSGTHTTLTQAGLGDGRNAAASGCRGPQLVSRKPQGPFSASSSDGSTCSTLGERQPPTERTFPLPRSGPWQPCNAQDARPHCCWTGQNATTIEHRPCDMQRPAESCRSPPARSYRQTSVRRCADAVP